MTFERIQDILVDKIGLEKDGITPESSFESLKIDSLDMVELICTIEDEFSVEFGENMELSTVSELVAYVDGLSEA